MSLALRCRSLQGARQGLVLAATTRQLWPEGAAAGGRRLLGTTPSDEFNREMAEFFGVPQPGGGGSGAAGHQGAAAPSAAAAAAPGVPSAAAAAGDGRLVDDMLEFNSELLGVLGAPQEQPEASASPTANLAQQLAAAAAAAASATGRAAPTQLSSQNSVGSFASSAAVAAPGATTSSSSGSSSSGSSGSSFGGGEARLTHVDAGGRAAMVDVSHKRDSVRTAAAGARVLLGPDVYALVAANQVAKGDVLTVAQLAGVMGAKHTATLIPLCHNIPLSKVHVSLALVPEASAVDIVAEASTVGPTGVEMEALTAAAVAALTVYDMCKAASKGIEISGLRLLRKSGGKSGDWARSDD